MSKALLDYILKKEHHKYRIDVPELAQEYKEKGLSPVERMTDRFERLCKAETPVFLPDEKICFVRTVKNIPDCFTEEEWADFKEKYYIHELGYLSNLSPDYEDIIKCGLLAKRETANEYQKRSIDAILGLVNKYKEAAIKEGKTEIAKVLERVPAYGATSFIEALQSFRILHFAMWLEGNYHNTVGRLDKYMYPYLKADMDKGLYTEETALELVEDFFLSFNKDSDLYVGVQQGDNGQSMMLGGVDKDGNEVFNLLSKLCLKASKNLLLIDPKINLRVSKNTPVEIYELGSELTKAGLGFPQYSNDDVVIDALVKLGYDKEDACEYVTAACWEFIIPKVGADVANIGALSFPKVVDAVLKKSLLTSESYEAFEKAIKDEIYKECDEICAGIKDLWFVPSPFMSVMCNNENVHEGGKYNNFGIHGTGVATGSDSLAVIKKYVFDEKSITKEELLKAVETNFENAPELLHKLRYEAPKMGNNIDFVDDIAVWLLDTFGEALKGKKNCRGGIFRAGTGSAMFYLWHANEIGASPDGRLEKEPFGTNFSASIFADIKGPLSVIKSFSKPHFENVINGGPLTLEFHNSMFKDEDSVKKVAMLVKSFVELGGHQLQLNAVNLETLKDAQAHPEKYQQLVVRIWGWSAYFVELDKEYQDHVMLRQEYTL